MSHSCWSGYFCPNLRRVAHTHRRPTALRRRRPTPLMASFRCARPQSLGHEVTTPQHKTDNYTPQIDLTVSPNIKSRFGDGVTEAVAPVVSRPTLCECLWHPAEGCAKWTEGRACAHKYKACSYTHKFWSLRDPRAPRASAPLFAAAGPVPVLCVQFVKV